MFSHFMKLATVLTVTTMLGACGTFNRLANIGQAPELKPIGDIPTVQRSRSLGLPLPHTSPNKSAANSLWRTGAKAFFHDHRAANVGDIVTVIIAIEDTAEVENETSRTRTTSEDSDLTSFLGLESKLSKFLPNAVNPASLTSFGSSTSMTGNGTIDRSETIDITIAAIVSHVLPNGNMIIQGRQEVRVNFEVREIFITGIIRPNDISNLNTINHTQIAEARIIYGGRGQLTDVQQARYGQQLFDILFPF